MQEIDVRPVLFVGMLQTPYDVGDMLKVTLKDGNTYHGEIQEIDIENCTIVMYDTVERENIVSFYVHQIESVDESI